MVGKRVYMLELALNARRGVNRSADRLVQRPELIDTPEGKQQREWHDVMLTEYYQRRGCNLDTGIPTRARR